MNTIGFSRRLRMGLLPLAVSIGLSACTGDGTAPSDGPAAASAPSNTLPGSVMPSVGGGASNGGGISGGGAGVGSAGGAR